MSAKDQIPVQAAGWIPLVPGASDRFFGVGELQVHLLQAEVALTTLFILGLLGQGLTTGGLLSQAIGTHRDCEPAIVAPETP